MNRETIDRIKKTVHQLAPELEVLKGEKGDKGDSMSWKGAHRKNAQYLRFDVVTHDDAAWLATERTKAAPPYAPWVMLCRSIKGERGEQGAQGVQGLIGKQGPEGPQGVRGEPGMVWTGSYQSGRRYGVGDVVSLDGSAYVAVGDTEQSPDGGAGWQVLVRRGDTGTQGPRGPKGETGATGFDPSAVLTLTNTTASTSTSTGALTVAGGVGVAGALYVGEDSFINGVRVGCGAGVISNSTAVGANALISNTIGVNITAVGASALEQNTSGNGNTAIGQSTLFSNTIGENNTAIGNWAGYGTGTNANTTGSNNTFIGNGSVGAAASDNNTITLGNASITTLRCQVGSITTFSDARDKTDIAPLAFGLNFINALNPVSFTWNMRQPEPKDGEPVEVYGKVGVPDIGFIAQELQAAQQATGVTIPGLVHESNPDRLEASPSAILPALVKAVQQLSAQVTALQAQVAALEV